MAGTSSKRGRNDVAVVGHWARDKLALLTEYIKISRGARAKYLGRSEAAYVDPFCGSGRARYEGTDEELDGSPVAAWKAAVGCGVPFSRVFIADASQTIVTAAATRLRELKAPVYEDVGDANETVMRIRGKLNAVGLHFAFLDPYNLGDLPFSVIRELAQLKRVDLMIHLSTGDLQRNLSTYSASEHATLEAFAPGWRSVVDFNASPFAQRQAIVEHWFSLLKGLELRSSS